MALFIQILFFNLINFAHREINFVPWEINFVPHPFISTFCVVVAVLLLHMKWALHRKGGKPAVQKSVKKVPRRQKSGQFIQKKGFFTSKTMPIQLVTY